MTYLIDTHVLLWLLFSPKKLSSQALSIIEDSKQNILVSQISFWEISLKYGLGKLKLKKYKPEDLLAATKQMNFSILEFHNDHLLSYYKLAQSRHKDPFDRFLIWQAMSLDIPIISKDETFMIYKTDGLKIIW